MTPEKRNKFMAIEEGLKRLVKEMQEQEEKEGKGVIADNPDKRAAAVAEDNQKMTNKVIKLVQQDLYSSAESLLRHIYRRVTGQAARTAIASARRLCTEANRLDAKWVKRRAAMMRQKRSASDIRKERTAKYSFSKKQEILDLLTTALLEVTEGLSVIQGQHYAELHTHYEVVLPPLHPGEKFTDTVVAPVFVMLDEYLNKRRFIEAFIEAHGEEPQLKQIESRLWCIANARVIGFAGNQKITAKDGEKLLRRQRRFKNAVLSEHKLVHHSSLLFWFLYNLPLNVKMVYFADRQLADDYSYANESLLGSDMSRDDFIRRRIEVQAKKQRERTEILRARRLAFEKEVAVMRREIADIENAIQEISEVRVDLRNRFRLLTAFTVEEDENDGLAITSYKKLRQRMLEILEFNLTPDPQEQQAAYELMYEDTMKARVVYHEHEVLRISTQALAKKRENLLEIIENRRIARRGRDKNAYRAHKNLLDAADNLDLVVES